MPREKKKNDEVKKLGFGQVSRRAFLKDAGIMVGAPTIGTMAASAELTAAESEAGAAKVQAPPSADIIQVPAGTTTIELTVNGDKYRLAVEPNWSLRQIIRDEIGLTSPKDWCGGVGACGSCTVIMNGRAVLSCLTLACECNGAKIETAEGIAKAKHPIIHAYIN